MPLVCQSVFVKFGIAFARIVMGLGTSDLLDVKVGNLQRSLQVKREACIVGGRCCIGNGFHTSIVGLRTCSILLQRISGEGVNQFKLCEDGGTKIILSFN